MSRIRVEKNGIKIKLPKQINDIWTGMEKGDYGIAELYSAKPIDPIVTNIIAFLAVSNEMVGAYLDNWRYIFGDVDCLDMEEWADSIIVRVEI